MVVKRKFRALSECKTGICVEYVHSDIRCFSPSLHREGVVCNCRNRSHDAGQGHHVGREECLAPQPLFLPNCALSLLVLLKPLVFIVNTILPNLSFTIKTLLCSHLIVSALTLSPESPVVLGKRGGEMELSAEKTVNNDPVWWGQSKRPYGSKSEPCEVRGSNSRVRWQEDGDSNYSGGVLNDHCVSEAYLRTTVAPLFSNNYATPRQH